MSNIRTGEEDKWVSKYWWVNWWANNPVLSHFRDAERRRKVKELERDLASERHEIRQMEKMNRKK